MKTKTKPKSSAKQNARSLQRVVSVRSYAWLCDFGLCRWSEPHKHWLTDDGKPSPEAQVVPVRIITEKEYRKLKAR